MNQIAKALIESEAVHIKPNEEEFFTWTSGKKSPIYCDNRTLISFPKYRKIVVEQFLAHISKNYSDTELIAGTATAGIPWAAWIAEALNLPMVYIRSKAKGHGLKTAIEGKAKTGQRTLIIEDLISTGKSSIESYHHALNDKLEVQAVLSIFTYNFSAADEKFKEVSLEKYSLCTLEELLLYARENKLLSSDEATTVKKWKESF